MKHKHDWMAEVTESVDCLLVAPVCAACGVRGAPTHLPLKRSLKALKKFLKEAKWQD